jgi:hypothetical protein
MQSRIARISLLFFVGGAVFWLGGVNIRALIGNDLLVMGTLDFEPNIPPAVERFSFHLVSASSVVVNIAYLVTLVSSIVFLRATSLRFKQHGWLMMSAILSYLFIPVEIYSMFLDAKMVYLDMFVGSNDLVEFRKLFIHRLAAFSGVPIIALFCYYTAIGLAIFRPLKKVTPQPSP